MRRIAVLLAAAVFTGCASARILYLGIPEDKVQTIEQTNPEIDNRLRGLATVSKVCTVDYTEYLRLKKGGSASNEERHGEFLYFAVHETLEVPLVDAGPEDATGAYLDIVKRYKAVVPKGE